MRGYVAGGHQRLENQTVYSFVRVGQRCEIDLLVPAGQQREVDVEPGHEIVRHAHSDSIGPTANSCREVALGHGRSVSD